MMKYLIGFLFTFLLFSGCHSKTCTPVVITQGGSCQNTDCGWLCNVAYAEVTASYSPVPNPSPLMNGLGPQKSGNFWNPHIGDTQFTTCDLNPACKSTIAVPVPFGPSATPSGK